MPRFLDIHTVPGVRREAILRACTAMKGSPGVDFIVCHYDLEEGKVFCLTEAESEEVVREAHLNIDLPYESIRPVVPITPADLA